MTLVWENHQINKVEMQIKNKDWEKELKSIFYICSNEDCKKISLDIDLFNLDKNRDNYAWIYRYSTWSKEQTWKLLPNWLHKIYPDYIPKSLLQDYQEAYAIKELSPKASATLSRRCLQWIIRDFWWVTKWSLYEEINAIEEKIDPLLFKAIDAVRHIWNIWVSTYPSPFGSSWKYKTRNPGSILELWGKNI